MRGAAILIGFGVTVALLATLVAPQMRHFPLVVDGLGPSGEIRGRVVWSTKTRDGRGEVYLKRISDEAERSTPIRPDGGFSFTGLVSGEYQLVIVPEGVIPIVRERVVVGRGTIDVGTFSVGGYLMCQCREDRPTTGIRVQLADDNGSRVPRAWLAVDPVGSVQQFGLPFHGVAMPIGPRLHCLCGRDPVDLGRIETLALSPGTYTLAAVAVGYEQITVRNVVVESRRLTDVRITWTPSAVPDDVVVRVLPGQGAPRILTLVPTQRL